MRYTSLPDAITDHGIWAAAGVNEANVGMTATETLTSNERVLGADPLVEYRPAKGKPGDEGYEPELVGGIGEEDIVPLVLPYIHSAREGVERLGALLGTYGTYEMNGIAFSDTDEIWWLETVGGHHWIARRVPDDAYVVMPNQLGIDAFDLTDAEGDRVECMASPDLREFIEKNHLDRLDARSGEPGDAGAHVLFNPRDAFGSHSDSDHVYNTPRAWDMHRFLSPHMDWTLADGEGWGPEADDLPWCLPPERPVSVEDVKYVLSLHYQGTPYDPATTRSAASTARSASTATASSTSSSCARTRLPPRAPSSGSPLAATSSTPWCRCTPTSTPRPSTSPTRPPV